MTSSSRRRDFLSASLLAVAACFASPVMAQDAQSGATPEGFDDIVVTARRTNENAQSVPIAVAAVSAKTLQQASVTDSQDLKQLIPGFQINIVSSDKQNAYIFVRGQRNFDDSVGTYDVPVSVYVDNVYYSRTGAAISNLFDVQSVQVYKGPQGTLFGRNTTGGVLNITTNDPRFETGASYTQRIGNYSAHSEVGVVNLALTDKLAIRGAFAFDNHKGYVKNVYPGAKDLSDNHESNYRVKLRWQPDESFTLDLQTSGRFVNTSGPGYHAFDISRSSCSPAATAPQAYLSECRGYTDLLGNSVPAGFVTPYINQVLNGGFWTGFSMVDQEAKIDMYTYSGVAQKKFDHVNVKWTAAYSKLYSIIYPKKIYYGTILDSAASSGRNFLATFAPDKSQNFQSDLTFSGDDGFDNRLKWAAGAFYFRESSPLSGTTSFQSFTPPANPSRNMGGYVSESKALYGQGTFSVTPAFRFTAGLRRTWDSRSITHRNATGGYNLTATPNPSDIFSNPGVSCLLRDPANPAQVLPIGQCERTQNANFKAWTWTLAADYDLADHTLVYATTRRGYRAGGLNLRSILPALDKFDPETVQDYEVGLKSDWFIAGMPIRTNIAAYYSDYRNLQRSLTFSVLDSVPGCTPVGPPACVQNIIAQNAKKARIVGTEVEVTARPTSALTLSASGSYTNAKFLDYTIEVPAGFALAPGSTTNLAGRPFGLPEWSAAAAITYELPIADALDSDGATLRVDYSYQSRFKVESPASLIDPRRRHNGYSLVNARVSVDGIAHSGLSAALFVRNAFKERYYATGGQTLSGPGLGGVGVFAGLPGNPRTFGLEVSMRVGGEK